MRFLIRFLLCFLFLAGKNVYGQFPYADSFKETTANGTVLGGTAKLTAKSGIDAPGQGYLRLTRDSIDQSGYARNKTEFNSSQGLSITFEYFAYGGRNDGSNESADGISFFLFDSDVENLDPDVDYSTKGFGIGQKGGALSYSRDGSGPGLRLGVIGIGFDEFGNFATTGQNKQSTIPSAGRIRQNLTIRGDGNGSSSDPLNYEFLTRVITYDATTTPPTGFKIEGTVDGRTAGFSTSNPGYRKARILLTRPSVNSPNFIINVSITVGGSTVVTHNILQNYSYTPNSGIPAKLSYGLGASTGGFVNFHEIRNIEIVIPDNVRADPVAVNDTVSTAEDQPKSFNVIQNDYDPNGNSTIDLASVDLIPATPAIDKSITIPSEGTYTVDNQGIVLFTPALNYTGVVTPVKYRISDKSIFGGASNEGSFIITVTPVNDSPTVAAPATFSVNEDTPTTITGVTFADLDAGVANVLVTFTLPANSGTVSTTSGANNITVGGTSTALTLSGPIADINTFITDNKLRYTPALNSNSDVILGISISDLGNSGSGGVMLGFGSLTFKLQPVNDAPTVSDVPKTGKEDLVLNFTATDFSSKFTDVDLNALVKIKVITLPTNGVLKKGDLLVVAGDEFNLADISALTFNPGLNWNGNTSFNWNGYDGFTYAAQNAAVAITIDPVNDAPVPGVIEKTGTEDVILTFSATDFSNKYSDIENDPFTKIKISGLPANGTLKKSGTNLVVNDEVLVAELANITFTPATNFNGVTSFLWSAHDGNSFSVSSAAVNITLTPVDDPPVAVNDAAATESGTPVTFSVLANDTDPDGASTIDITSVDIDPAAGTQTSFVVAGQGTYVANNNGTVTFSPVTNYNSGVGTTTPVMYTFKDNTGRVSNQAAITIKVTPKVAPVANPDEATTAENAAVTFNVLTNDTDANGNSTINAASVDLDPATGGRQSSITVAGQGTYTVNNAGAVTFTPLQFYNSGAGTATPISYTVNDVGGLTSNAASITVTVTSVPDAPLAVADAVTTNEDNSVTFSVIANDIDRDGNSTIDPTSIDFDPGTGVKTSITVAGEGTYNANTNGTVTFIPVSNYNSAQGTATPISYTIKDNTGLVSNAAQITVTVSPVNDLPVVANVPKSGNQGQTVTFTEADFKTKFTDPENSPLTRIRVSSLPQNGTLKLYATNVTVNQEIPVSDIEGITFTPNPAFNGITSFAWNGNDGAGYAAINANVVITLAAVNQPPVLTPVIRNYTGNSSVTFAASDFTSQFSDPENNPLTRIQIVALPASGTLKLFGVDVIAGQEIPVGDISGLTYVPEPGSSGTFNFRWNGSDGTAYATGTSTVSITVTPSNVRPVVSDITKSGTGFTDITFTAADFTSKFIDADNNGLEKVKIINLPLNGTLRLNGVNVIVGQEIPLLDLPKLTFQSALNWSGTTNFAWNGYDGKEYALNNANVTISIILLTDPNAKIGVAKSVTSITDGVNGTYNVKFTFSLVNYGPNAIENISLKDNLTTAFAGTEFTVRSLTALGNLKSNTSFNGMSDTELLLPASRLLGGEERKVELEINVRLVSNSGTFFNFALAEGSSAVTGAKVQDRSTNGLKPDPVVNGDVSLSETTPIKLDPRPTFIPQGFTPNGDGINDNLIIQNTLNQKIAIEVFNRWGNRVYKSIDYKNDWTGRCTEGIYLGQDIPDGTYFYVVIVDDKSKYVGSLTVQR